MISGYGSEVQGSAFKGYNKLKLLSILIYAWNNQHSRWMRRSLSHIEDKNHLIITDQGFSTLNPEPLNLG